MQLYLIRHGQSTSDIEDRYGGAYDDHLTDEGKMQAEKLAQRLQNQPIEMMYYSPLLRARETALILQKKLGCKLELAPAFAERNKYGILSGVTKMDALKTYPQLVALLTNDHNTIIDAEAYDTFVERVLTGFRTLTAFDGPTFAVITHGGPIKLLLKELFQRKVRTIQDCGWVEIEKSDTSLFLRTTESVLME